MQRLGNRTFFPCQTGLKQFVYALPHSKGIMRRSTLLSKFHVFRTVSKPWKQIVSKHPLVTLSRNVFNNKGTRWKYFVCYKPNYTIARGEFCKALYTCCGCSQPITDSSACLLFPAVQNCTHQKNTSF